MKEPAALIHVSQPAGEMEGSGKMRVRVESYAGYKANERPLCFYLGDTAYRVEELLDQWYSPGKTYFRVRAHDGNVYILCHDGSAEEGAWTLASFRKS